tara:strand:- start:312 stop:599 length:288 start_codon:yes stop_codon:yes gene_type:complete
LSNYPNNILQHPNTPEDLLQPNLRAELTLQEIVPTTLEIMHDYDFETISEDFVKDYKIVIEITRAILYGQLGIRHDLHIGLGLSNPLNNPKESEE